MPLLSTHIFKKICSFLRFLIYLHRCVEIQVFLSVLQQKPSQALPRQIPPFVTYGDIFPRSGGSLSSKGEPLAKPVTLQLSRKVCRSAALSQKAALQMPFTFTPPSSENTMPERPQTLRHCSLKNYSSSEHGRSKAEAIPDRSPQNFSRIWYHTTPPWVEPETPSFTKPNFA